MKNLFLSAIVTFTLMSVNAQDISYGVKAGVNIANTCSSNTDPRTSFHLGGMVEF